jgi:hypothetical protein
VSRALPVAVACAALSCGGEPVEREQLMSIRLLLEPQSCIFYCETPEGCPLDCDGPVGVWVVDAATDEVIDSDCLDRGDADDDTLLELADVIDDADLIPVSEGLEVIVEVAAFVQPTAEGGCSRVREDPSGDLPHTDFFEYPLYFARSAPVRLGDEPVVIDAPVQCVQAFSCDSFSNTDAVQAYVFDLERGGPPEAPELLDVHIGTIFYDFSQDDALAHTVFSFGSDLEWDGVLGAWTAPADEVGFVDPTCIGTIVTRLGPNFSAPTASCEGFGDFEFVSATAYYVDKEITNDVLDELGLDEFPATGLLFGRVIDGFTGLPAAGVVVAPDAPETTSTILYLDTDELTGDLVIKPSPPTSANGWFVVTELAIPGSSVPGMGDPGRSATCCTLFTASTIEGFVGYSNAAVGLIDGVAMGATIYVSGPDGTVPLGAPRRPAP